MKTTKSGNWSDASVWDGSGGDREINHAVIVDRDVTSNERVFVSTSGKLDFQAVLTMNNKNLVYEGIIYSRPNSKKRGIRFININEQLVQGSGMVEMPNDIGLWGFLTGKLDIEGTHKTAYTFVTGSAKKGESFVNVINSTGWNTGDEIVVGTMEEPLGNDPGWNEADTIFTDHFIKKFERRTITSISGNRVNFTGALLFDHDQVVTDYGTTHTCPVVNLTRDFVIEGTPTGRAHIFHTAHNRQGQHAQHANIPHNIKNIEGRFLGQRKGLFKNSNLVVGRYALHFHHNGDGTKGTIIENCSFHDIGNRCYVPHMSNGITMKNNTLYDCLHVGWWWDDRENSHSIVWDGNLGMCCRPAGDGSRGEGMLLGMGDENVAINNLMYYCNGTELHNNNGAYAWNADSEGVWIFKNNKAFASTTGLFVWQNTGNNHTIEDYEAVNCIEGIQHGAYINSYIYRKCKFWRSVVLLEAASGNTNGVVFELCKFSAGGKPFSLRVIDSPAGSDPLKTNKIIKSDFTGHTVAGISCESILPVGHDDKRPKHLDVIECNSTGNLFQFGSTASPMVDGWRIRVQPKSGQAYQVQRSGQRDVRNDIPDFAPKYYGTGEGLKGEYFVGTNFTQKKFERIDSMIMFQGWSPDPKYAPYGVHHLVQGDLYSVRWSGFIEPQYNEPHTFHFEGSGGHRLWINKKLVIDSWTEKADNNSIVASSGPVTFTGKTEIIIEHFNSSGARGCLFYWKSPSMPIVSIVPMSQLYSGSVVLPPPQVFKSVRKTKDFTRNNCPAGQTGELFTYSVDAGQFESTISQADADAKADADIAAKGQQQANQFGTCKIITMPTPCETFVAADYLELQPDVKAAGYNLGNAINHYNTYGVKEKRRANKLCLDPSLTPAIGTPPPPGRTLKSTIKVYSDGSIEVA